jgi:hypothetical protein
VRGACAIYVTVPSVRTNDLRFRVYMRVTALWRRRRRVHRDRCRGGCQCQGSRTWSYMHKVHAEWQRIFEDVDAVQAIGRRAAIVLQEPHAHERWRIVTI